jgi:hypothetical protein
MFGEDNIRRMCFNSTQLHPIKWEHGSRKGRPLQRFHREQVTWPTFTSNAGYPGCPVPCMHSRSDVHSAEISHLASIFPGFSRHPAFFATSLSFITTRNSGLTVLATGGDPPPIRFINRVSITHAVYQYETAYSTRIHLSSKYRWFSYP